MFRLRESVSAPNVSVFRQHRDKLLIDLSPRIILDIPYAEGDALTICSHRKGPNKWNGTETDLPG